MLTVKAQPTSSFAQSLRGQLRAAGVAILLTVLVLTAAQSPPAVAAQDAAAGGNWPWPVLGEVITHYKNGSDRYAAGQHRGLDIAAPVGTPVRAIVDGRVSFSGRLPDGGSAVTLKSRGGSWLVSSLHLSSTAVRQGARVTPGQVIGRIGTSGLRSAAETHVHLSVRRADTRDYVDPMSLLGARRLAGAQSVRAPQVHSLERPAAATNNVRARTTGDARPATRHGVQARRVSAGRSAGKHAHEGHAAEGIGRVAPPPIRQLPVRAERSARPAESPAAAASPAEQPAPVHEAQHTGGPKRNLLLAIAAICLVALILRRRPATSPSLPEKPTTTELAEVIAFDDARRSA
jgi:hypothetical protein